MYKFLFDVREAYELILHCSVEPVEIEDVECIVSNLITSYIFSNKEDINFATDQLERLTTQEVAESIINVITVSLVEPIYQTLSSCIEYYEGNEPCSDDVLKMKCTLINESDLYVTYNPKITRENDGLKRYYKQAIENGDYIPERERLILERLQ